MSDGIDALKELHSKLSAIENVGPVLEAFPFPVLIADSKGIISFLNRPMELLLRYTREEMIGQPVEMLMPERFRASHAGHRKTFDDDPRPRSMGQGSMKLFCLRKDGEEIPAEISLGPMVISSGMFTVVSIRRSDG